MYLECFRGDCLEVLKEVPDECIDSIATDPPYGLSKEPDIAEVLQHWLAGDDYHHRGSGFMGKKWDSFVPGPSVWKECLRTLRPGGYLLSFAGARTMDLMGMSIRLGGFEIRDTITWLYGSGFPKSMNVAQAIDKAARGVPQGGTDPTSINHGKYKTQATEGKRSESDRGQGFGAGPGQFMKNQGRTNDKELVIEARPWQGWGTALKPAYEPIIMARKPLQGTVAKNVLEYGTGALNIDGCRIATEDNLNGGAYAQTGTRRDDGWGMQRAGAGEYEQPTGRWPANVVLDEEAGAMLDEQSGTSKSSGGRVANISATSEIYGGGKGLGQNLSAEDVRGDPGYGDVGGASRFFYCAKASKNERNTGLGEKNNHPTVKPIALMRWLVRLITPPEGIVLDPYMGSGTTGIAAVLEGFDFLGIELEKEYITIAEKRIEHYRQHPMAA